MILFKKSTDLHKYLFAARQKQESIGFVPTMGALHHGHISLIRACLQKNPSTICSIFVNPTQFNDPNDYQKYPLRVENDIRMLDRSNCPVLFLPSVAEVYPEGITHRPHYDLGYLEQVLEGKFRPGHFQGVCMVMERLLRIVDPDNLYLGQKDFQQCMIISRLIEIMGQADRIRVTVYPTLREPDGLAMSSRNLRLNETQRKKSPLIYQALTRINRTIRSHPFSQIKSDAIAFLNENGFQTDYVEIARTKDLLPADHWDDKEPLIALIAVWMEEVRLIDNLLLGVINN